MGRSFISTRERKVVEALKPQNQHSQLPSARLGMSESNINTTLTFVFSKFMDALRLMADDDQYKTFRGRLKKNAPEINKLTRQIRALAREAEKT